MHTIAAPLHLQRSAPVWLRGVQIPSLARPCRATDFSVSYLTRVAGDSGGSRGRRWARRMDVRRGNPCKPITEGPCSGGSWRQSDYPTRKLSFSRAADEVTCALIMIC